VDSLTDDLETIAALLPRIVEAQRRRLVRELADHGLTFPQFITLTALEPFAEGRRMGPLAAAALQSAASMTGIVDRLLEQGLVERERHPEDRRAVIVRLTAKGSALLAQVKATRRQEGRALLESFSPQDRHQLRRVLTRVVEQMETNTDGD